MGGLRGRGSCYKLNASIKSWAHLAKIAILDIFDFWQFYKKGSASTMHNFLSFDFLEVLLDFLESLRCPLTNPFCLIGF